ncbi:hypothetical protein TREMEDRAFT_33136 [Tremella mesenterica DSM 1558]|uniref:uncharacterized protein n=1 Tax=Tremella mesenterica (strain ATCC 24925 / CBS 8224 / DSM 1558 / NBRC 9311 / NRRL Y-6157 / RJB 2259-6 / UBC 559-6) TaxID=578456 RepID=UPI0003F4910B|nr:uncharacterized protein TREMEDRAFT_33136 [Tremella mesenterica DSM 1558]EIW68088.1 hypothetical protein TREMEDRAFT_33136 [Tremella mesenterica DSM 1558]
MNSNDSEPVMKQIWHNVVDTLRLLPSVPPPTPPSGEEQATLSSALDKLSVLISMRKEVSSTVGSTTNTVGIGSGNSNLKRKRRLSTHSPIPPISTESALTSLASPNVRGNTPLSREATGKQRKEMYADQLPLQSGRRVAFRLPAAKQREEDGEEGWILAFVRKCIQMDKMRYEVHDADDVTATYNTTLRSLIPLPDPTAPLNHPSNPSQTDIFPIGTQVLALYPDTTAFYRATVISPAAPGKRGKHGGGENTEWYKLMFVDDGERVHEVDRCSVVLVSCYFVLIIPSSLLKSLTYLLNPQFIKLSGVLSTG